MPKAEESIIQILTNRPSKSVSNTSFIRGRAPKNEQSHVRQHILNTPRKSSLEGGLYLTGPDPGRP